MSVPMSSAGPGRGTLLLDRRLIGQWTDFDVAPDGRIIAIVTESAGAAQPLTVMTNWRSRIP
jgi:hypothetical protein